MLKERTIAYNATIIEALKRMDELDKKLLIVMHGNIFYGLVSVGDLQRAIIQNKALDTRISEVIRKNVRIASPDDDFESIKKMMFDFRMELCPVVNHKNRIVEVHCWENVFLDKELQPKRQFNLPVVIMAGGFGTRLKPLTTVLPKPLIPIGDKTIIEQIFQRFNYHGCNNFFISVNYKSELIEYYLSSQNLPYQIDYIQEYKPNGTAGSLSLLKDKITGTFFVSNCDIIIEQDYSEILEYHYNNKNDITVVAALKHYRIPYGTIETSENGKLEKLSEKPELTFKINSGMYILEPNMLKEIPENEFFHITDLIEKVKNAGSKVGVFPISEKSWKDIGEWDEYLKNNKI